MAEVELFGGYVLLKRLGSGAMGDVHLARSVDGSDPVVLKRLHGRLATDSNAVRRFRHEAEVAARVNSPHVAKVFGSGMIDGTLYIAMEYIAGWPLSRIISELAKRDHLPSIPVAMSVIEGAISGLDAIHNAIDPDTGGPLAIIHRDIAPKNIMVGEDGRSRLIDLGVGRSSARDWKTRTGLTVGTPGYMPPEQMFAESIDHRVDLFAMGVVLFELLTLVSYVERGSVGMMLKTMSTMKPRPPSLHRPDIPRAIDALVLKALALRPEDRFQSAAEMLAAIRAAVPQIDSRGAVELVNDLLWGELNASKTEVVALLAQPDTREIKTIPSGLPPPARKPRLTLGLVGLMMLLFVAGIAIDRLMIRASATAEKPPPPQVEPQVEAHAPPPPIEVVERARVEAEPAPVVEAEPPRIKPKKIALPPPSPPPPPSSPKATVVSPEQLQPRALALKKKFEEGSDEAKAVAEILRKLSLGMGAESPTDWADVERRIEKLERQ